MVLFDEDGDGVCNGDETVGCTDPLACNGGFFTDTDNSQCIYADEACEICVAGDVVLFDADGDGVCDSDEVSGCTDVLACNFDGFATDEDDSCLYSMSAGFVEVRAFQPAIATATATSLTHWVSAVGTVSPTRMGMAFVTAMKMVEDRPIAVGERIGTKTVRHACCSSLP